jgi:hypothetical protein
MSDTAITTTGNRGQGEAPPSPPQGYKMWRRVRRAGYVLLGLQLVSYLVWSVVLYDHFSLTWDFSIYHQAWYLIAHGNLDPYSTPLRARFLYNDGELIPYFLAPLYWIFHTGIVLQWAQDLGLAGAELVVFTWLCDLARRHCAERDAAWLAGLGLLLFLVNPWLWATISFDVHEEPMAIFFAAFLAWDLSRGRRRAWVWVVPVLLGGVPTTTYVIGLGLGGVLAGGEIRRMGARMVATGIAYSLLLSLMQDNGGAAQAINTYVAEVSGDPFSIAAILWDGRVNLIANLAPVGLVGIGFPLILPIALMITVSDALLGPHWAAPLFQNMPLYVFLPVGTVAVLAWLLKRHRRTALVLAGVTVAQAIGWAAVWGPQIPVQWLRVSSAESATLSSVQASIPGSAEVAASQGVLGRFSGRTYVYPLLDGSSIPVRRDTWFVILPTAGVETLIPATSLALIGELAGPLHATLVAHANGVWAFRLTPSPGVTSVRISGGSSSLPAWAGTGAASQPVLGGAVSGWHMAATGARGYVSDGMEWLESPGRYRVEVTLFASAAASRNPVNVEVWDDNTYTLLARRGVTQTDGIQQIMLPVAVPAEPDETVFRGWGPFRAAYVSPPRGQHIEVRVWSPGGVAVNVYSGDLTIASGALRAGSLVRPVDRTDAMLPR